jgi:hypothetical protein
MDVAEGYAEGRIRWGELARAARVVRDGRGRDAREENAVAALRAALAPSNEEAAARRHARLAAGSLAEAEVQRALLHDVMGNPFRPIPSETELYHRSGSSEWISQWAGRIHDQGRFDELPFLGDALEDAGCCDQALLDHCRSTGPHGKGCWAVDAVRGLELPSVVSSKLHGGRPVG